MTLGTSAGTRRGECRYCKAEILWATTEKGRPMPLDPTPQVFVMLTGMENRATTVRGYVAHWATCPERATARADADAKREP